MTPTAFVGIDLSKAATGWSMFTPHPGGKQLHTKTLKIPGANQHTRTYAYIAHTLADLITDRLNPETTLVAVEYPAMGLTASELQWYLFQEVIYALHKARIETVSFSVLLLKKFIKLWYPTETKPPAHLQKEDIADAYHTQTQPLNPWLPMHVDTHDARDALYLSLLAWVSTEEAYGKSPNPTQRGLADGDLHGLFKASRGPITRYLNVPEGRAKDWTAIKRALVKNNHLRRQSHFWFPHQSTDTILRNIRSQPNPTEQNLADFAYLFNISTSTAKRRWGHLQGNLAEIHFKKNGDPFLIYI